MSDSYRTIIVTFRSIAPSGKAIFVDKADTRGSGTCSIPRSLIHTADDDKLDGLFDGEEVTLRVFDWKAEELGFA